MELILPGTEPAAAPAATVLGFQVDGEPAGVIETIPYEERRAMLASRPFLPGEPPELDRASRTVFFDDQGSELTGPIVMIQGAADVPAVPAGVFRVAGWIVSDGDRNDRLGEVTGLATSTAPRSASGTMGPGEEVLLRFLGESTPRIGEEFLTYSLQAEIPGFGDVAVPFATVRVVDVGPSHVVARVEEGFGPLRVGHLVTLARTFPLSPGVHPAPSDLELRMRLVGFQETKELHLPGDLGFVDRGAADGLAVGDVLRGMASGREGGPERAVARVQVVGVREATATIRVLSVEEPGALRPGLWMSLDAKMP